MLPLREGKYYRIIYLDGSHKNFQAISVPLAKHLIIVKTEDGKTRHLTELLSERWLDLFEVVEEATEFNRKHLNPSTTPDA
jgi:hypothetical protein